MPYVRQHGPAPPVTVPAGDVVRPHGARWKDRLDALALGRQRPAGWTGSTTAVARILADRCALDGTARVGLLLLAQLAGVHEQTARRQLARLVAAGLLVVEYRGDGRGHVSTYRLVLAAAEPVKGSTVSPIRPAKGFHGARVKGSTMHTGSEREDLNARASVPRCVHRVRMLAPGSCPHGCELLPGLLVDASDPAASVELVPAVVPPSTVGTDHVRRHA